MRSTRLAEAEDWEDDDMKRIEAAKGGEKQNLPRRRNKMNSAPHRVAALTALQRGS